jgi:hypothetical protein
MLQKVERKGDTILRRGKETKDKKLFAFISYYYGA